MQDFSNEPLEELILQTIPLIGRTLDAAIRQGQPFLSPVHFALLNLLEAGQALSQNELAEFLQVSPSTFSATVETLVKRGWLERNPGEQDRRKILINITPAGREVLEQVHRQALTELVKIVDTLGEVEKNQIMTGLRALRQAFIQNFLKEGLPVLPFPPPPGGMRFPPPFGPPFPK